MPEMTVKEAEAIQCPVCGYYCAGRGGVGCVDKPFIYEQATKREAGKMDPQQVTD